MEAVFHSQDQWKSAMMTLPDDVFFDLLRSVFGHIKTPFNKQNLLADLWTFFSREDVQRNLAAYIDETDAQVIAAVAILGKPTAGDLERFFAGDEGLSLQLLNLEERFILYRFREEGHLRLALNPALAPVLKSVTGEAFPSFPLEKDTAEARSPAAPESGRGDDRIFAALLSFFLEEGSPFGLGGRRRKKIVDTGKRIFPGVDLDASFRCFLRLGLIRPFAGPEGEILDIEDRTLGAFQELDRRGRLVYWAAGLVDAGNEAGDLDGKLSAPQLLRGRIRRLARFINGILGFLKEDRVYPVETLGRFLFILEWEDDAGPSTPDLSLLNINALCGAMVQAGLLCHVPRGYCLPEEPSERQTTPVLTVDAPFFCLIYPGIDPADVLALASFAIIRETGAVFRFELTRESCLRGFQRGVAAAEMGELLLRLSGNRVEPAVLWTLEDWEKRSKEVALFEGTFLALSPERRYLAETEALSAMIRRELAPGFYWLVPGAKVAEALRRAGVEVFLRSPGPEGGQGGDSGQAGEGCLQRIQGTRRLFPSPERELPVLPELNAEEADAGQDAEMLKTRFRQILAGRSLSAAERKELTARIDRRLVLAESQLSADSVRAEKLEARGLDYVGKASIARQAISTHSLLEVVWSSPEEGGREQRVLALPLGLEKSGGESILVAEDSRPPGDAQAASDTAGNNPAAPRMPGNTIRIPGNTIRIPLGKISFLRRIKKSIFEV
ncbi:MAG: hypothetical protein LBB77_10230 [Treponema sp.]|jgi:hypothetical protein|nr:hypothetical protein [Treponema sp.]